MCATGCATYDSPLYLTPEERAEPASLVTGDPAPPVVAAEWLRGPPVTAYEPGTVYVIDFWSSWCGPCLASLPLLDDLVGRHQGRVVALAVTRIEEDNSPSDIRRTARELFPADSSVRVAIDSSDASTRAFRSAVRDAALPRTFIVDQHGRLAWWGHPVDAAPIVDAVLAERWDLDAARRADLEAAEQRAFSNRLVQQYIAAINRGDKTAALDAARGVCSVPVDRTDGMSPPWWAWPTRVGLLVRLDRHAEAEAVAREAGDLPGIRDEPVALSELVTALDPGRKADPSTARLRLDLARQAMELVDAGEARTPANSWEQYMQHAEYRQNGSVMVSASDALADDGQIEAAKALLSRAIARWSDDPRLVPSKTTLKARLAALESLPLAQ
ncbi:MAG: hypothetical protein GIKADHBN_00669 [Phycisphaerales bacterium]|nr:hypothetical protein [Phycisphaerales bacterium]